MSMTPPARLEDVLERDLWPVVGGLVPTHDLAGLGVAVVRGDEVVARGFGVRDVRTGEPVTSSTLFHLASVSKPFVATAVVSLATPRGAGPPLLDLDAPYVDHVPELVLADGRAGEITPRHLLTHTSGLGDVTDYGWHDPRLGDDALIDLARSLSTWRLQGEPGAAHVYSNLGYELLGLLLARVLGTTFEDAVAQRVLRPLGMRASTFLRAEVPADRGASPHVGMPPAVPGEAYPYTRRHAPSSTLHSNLDELCRWVGAHVTPSTLGPDAVAAGLDAELFGVMGEPAVPVGQPPWDDAVSLGWGVGEHRGHRVLSHSGADPGFGSRIALVPERATGVVVLANSNTVPTGLVARAALEVADRSRPTDAETPAVAELRALLPMLAVPVARVLAAEGAQAATAAYRRLVSLEPPEHDPDDEGFVDAVWGAIELHRTDLVWPLLRLWTDLRPDSSQAWAMTGWAHQVDGSPELARRGLRRALELDPDNEDAAQLLADVDPA